MPTKEAERAEEARRANEPLIIIPAGPETYPLPQIVVAAPLVTDDPDLADRYVFAAPSAYGWERVEGKKSVSRVKITRLEEPRTLSRTDYSKTWDNPETWRKGPSMNQETLDQVAAFSRRYLLGILGRVAQELDESLGSDLGHLILVTDEKVGVIDRVVEKGILFNYYAAHPTIEYTLEASPALIDSLLF